MCPRFRTRQDTRKSLTSVFVSRTLLMCPSTAEPGHMRGSAVVGPEGGGHDGACTDQKQKSGADSSRPTAAVVASTATIMKAPATMAATVRGGRRCGAEEAETPATARRRVLRQQRLRAEARPTRDRSGHTSTGSTVACHSYGCCSTSRWGALRGQSARPGSPRRYCVLLPNSRRGPARSLVCGLGSPQVHDRRTS